MIVSASPDFRRVMVLDSDGWAASRVNGDWSKGLKFSADELKDDFERVRDSAIAEKLVSEARAALART